MQDDDSDDEEEPEVEGSTIHTYDEALKVTNDLMLFLLSNVKKGYLMLCLKLLWIFRRL